MRLTARDIPPAGIDLMPICPAALAGLSIDTIRKIRLSSGAKRVALGDVFEVEGHCEDTVELRRIDRRCLRVGAGLEQGQIRVRGDVGDEAGRGMSNGVLKVSGNAGDSLASGLSGGRIEIGGDAGDHLGAPARGQTKGINRGVVIVKGNVGNHAAARMRRGVVVIHGSAGTYLGERMIAGTIVVLGSTDRHLGTGMRRGTFVLTEMAKSPGFAENGNYELPFLKVLFSQLENIDPSLRKYIKKTKTAQRWLGDLAHGGLGEVLVVEKP